MDNIFNVDIHFKLEEIVTPSNFKEDTETSGEILRF